MQNPIKWTLAAVIFVAISTCAVAAQNTVKRPALPGNLSAYIDEYPVKLMKVPAVKARLKALLGKRYADFDISIQVQSPMKQVGDFLFASGCIPHACTINEAAFAIDMKNKRVHAVIYDSEKPAKYFNEDKAATPQVLLDWIEEFGNP